MVNTFLYPRTIAVTRPTEPSNVGDVGYSGLEIAEETSVVSGLPASIQVKTTSSRERSSNLPGSPPAPIVWEIYIPREAGVTANTIQDRDVITDEFGRRFQIEAAYFHPMGWTIAAVRLEAH